MFYSQFILAKKGPLGTIWIAAHLERKLRKNQVADTDIGVSVDSILFPEMPIALRLSSHLLLGVVRIYSRKVNYLFDDCSEALLKVKQAFRSTAVDLPPEESTAPYHSITLPETFDLDDFELPDNEGNYVDHHISSKDQITLQDTMDGVVYSTSKFGLDERFGDDDASGLDLDEELLVEKAATADHATGTSNSDVDPQASSAHANDIEFADQLDDEYDGDNEPVDYAEAPSTPGLWEEPNLSNIQEISACDDHQEPENHITESAVKENLENASSKDAECLPHEHQNLHEKSPHVAGTQETFDDNRNQFEPHEKTLPHIEATEQILLHNQSELHEKTLPHIAATEQIFRNQFESHEKALPHNAATEQVLHHNQFEPHEITLPHIAATEQVLHHNQFEPHEKTLPHIAATEQVLHHNQFEPHEKTLPQMAATEQVLHPNQFESHEKTLPHIAATEHMLHHNQFEPHEKSLPHIAAAAEPMLMDNLGSTSNTESLLLGQSVPVSDHAKVEDLRNKTARDEQHGVWTANEKYTGCQENQNNACQLTAGLESNTELSGKDGLVGMPHVPASLDPKTSTLPVMSPHYGMPSSDFPGLRPCVTPLNHETNAQGSHATEALVNNFSEIHRAEIRQNEQVRVDNVIGRPQVQVDNINSPYTSGIPAPEKRLSLPHWLSDVPPRHYVPEATPLEKDMTATSGKKRSFAESSMTTVQNLNLNESSGFFTTTMTPTLNLNESSGFFTTNMTVQNPILNGSSSFFTSNMTVQNPNLNSSSGFFTTNMSVQNPNLNGSSGFTINMPGQPVVNDDDLLSSILVGRKSSILKMKPTPPVATPPTKRRRASAPKTGIPKRKVLMDDNMVLHGDTIRQQLTNTQDIRRLRKKAPCTRSEISMLEKQFWEDEIFSEPIFTGMSTKLASLHNHLRDIRKIVISHSDTPLEGGKDPKSISQTVEKDMQPEVGPSVPNKENGAKGNSASVAQPTEISSVTESQKCDDKSVNVDYYGGETQTVETGDVAETSRLEHDLFGEGTAMEIDANSFPGAADNIEVSVMPTVVEPPAHAANEIPSDTFDMAAALGEVQMDASQTDAPSVHSNENKDLQSDMAAALGEVRMDASLTDVPSVHSNENKDLQSDMAAALGEVQMDASQSDAPSVHLNENKDLQSAGVDLNSNKPTIDIASEIKINDASVKEISEEKHEQDNEFRKSEEPVVNEDAALTSNTESNAQSMVYNGIFGEDFVKGAAYDDTEVRPVLEDVSLDQRENSGHRVTFETPAMNVEDIPTDNRVVDDDEFTHPAVEHDTDFLNFDDADDDEGGDYAPDVEASRIIDNSGWSSRTKAVAKYLQIMFDKEGERGRNMLTVNNLLVGKTRKEASRMFFETLVLKTKDYIHVEQADPFGNINVFPRAKLLKSDF